MKQKLLQLSINGETGGYHNLHVLEDGKIASRFRPFPPSTELSELLSAALTTMNDTGIVRLSVRDPGGLYFQKAESELDRRQVRTWQLSHAIRGKAAA